MTDTTNQPASSAPLEVPDLDNLSAGPEEGGEFVRKRKRKKLPRREPTLNLVAMLDMAFQLLIFFVLTANFAKKEGVLAAALPQGVSTEAIDTTPPADPVRVTLKMVADVPTINVGGQEIDTGFEGLTRNMLAKRNLDEKGNPIEVGVVGLRADNDIIIAPDGDVPWQHVVNAFNAICRSRFTNIAIGEEGSARPGAQ